MLALQTVGICSILFIILSIYMYCEGYKEEGKMIFQGTLGAVGFYIYLVLLIGCMPANMG